MSTIKVDNIAPSAGGTEASLVRGLAKAWVNFNGTGTVAVRESENVSSLTDNGTGDYTINFSSVFDGSDYSPMTCGTADAGGFTGQANVQPKPDVTRVASGQRIVSSNSSNASLNDFNFVQLSIFGDLA